MTFELGNRSLSGNERNELFRNDGQTFTRIGYVTEAGSTLDGRGFVPADFDRDGDIDLFVVNNNQRPLYLENVFATQNWAVVQLKGRGRNSHGIGARVRLVAGGRAQVREIHVGSGYLSSPPPEAHFGLGKTSTVERIEVRWPSREVQVIQNVEANRVVVIEEGGSYRYLNLANTSTRMSRSREVSP